MREPITMAEGMAEESRIAGLQEGRQEGLRETLCYLAKKKFNTDTARQLGALLKTTDDPAVLAEVGRAIINRSTDKEFIDVCRVLLSSR